MIKKYKNIKCRFDLTERNCTYYPEFKATCPTNCPNRRRDIQGREVTNDYITEIEQQNKQMLEILNRLYSSGLVMTDDIKNVVENYN